MSHPTRTTQDAGPAAGVVRVGLVGQGIRKSRTPGMHEAEGHAQGLDYRYSLLDTAEGETGTLSEIVARAEAEGFAGLNVTYPFKRAILPLLDTMSEAATRVGAVNTVVFSGGRRNGHNTDLWGFAEGFRQGLPGAATGTVLLLGAGGAGSAVGHALHDLGAHRILVCDPKEVAAEALAAAINAAAGADRAFPVAAREAIGQADGIVNATPVGMSSVPGTPIDPEALALRQWVADIVYLPLETEFLAQARARGCRTLSGEGMAVFQAVRAFALFTGRNADAERMRQAFHALGERPEGVR